MKGKTAFIMALLGLALSTRANTSLTTPSEIVRTSSATNSTAQERVAALSRRFGIAPLVPLPQGATAATLAPGATQPALTFSSATAGTTTTPFANTNASSTAAATSVEPAVMIQTRAMMQTPSGYISTAAL